MADLIHKLYGEAMTGNVAAAREALDRVLGKPVQPTANEPDDGERFPVRVIFDLGDRHGDGPAISNAGDQRPQWDGFWAGE